MPSTLERHLPLFPLSAVVFPGQEARLTIIEPRYRQLIHESDQNGLTFGLTALLGEELSVFGTEVELLRIEKIHEDGHLIILVRGQTPFRILHYYRQLPERLYPGGEIQSMPMGAPAEAELQKRLAATYLLVSDLLPVQGETIDLNLPYPSWQFGLSVGLSMKQKIKLLSLPTESERQRLLLAYLTELLPALEKAVRDGRRAS